LEQSQQVIDAIRHCKVLGVRVVDISKGTLTTELPYSNAIVGNPDTGVIHGGALSTLLDTTCGMSVALSFDSFEICPTLDLRIDHMGAAKPGIAIVAHAEVYRKTKNVVFSRGKVYQDDEDKPIAHCVATFMRLPGADIKKTEKRFIKNA
jgi:uncharacterized protein (TIGR00369 family)